VNSPKEGALPPQPVSETAATAGNRLYSESGPMVYRVQVLNGSAITICDVEAKSGDEAAERALAKHPGQKVGHVEPAPQKQAA
jgi:hypothetical protein